MKTRRTRKVRKSRKARKTRGGYKQYLSNVGFRNGYETAFDRTMTTPSAIRTATNWA